LALLDECNTGLTDVSRKLNDVKNGSAVTPQLEWFESTMRDFTHAYKIETNKVEALIYTTTSKPTVVFIDIVGSNDAVHYCHYTGSGGECAKGPTYIF
jgi:hypothetical protein